MEPQSASQQSRIRRIATTAYDAQAGGRSPLLDGPWWLGIAIAAALAVLLLAPSPWRWLALPFVVALLSLPLLVRWAVALGRSVAAFRAGFRA